MDKWVHFQFDFTFASEKYRIFLSIRNLHSFYYFQIIIYSFISFEGKIFDPVLEFSTGDNQEHLSEWSIICLLFNLKRRLSHRNNETHRDI